MKAATHILISVILLAGGLRAFGQSERRALQSVLPEYPSIAAKMNLHGTVKLKIWVTADGSVRRLEYVGGHPLLAESALKAVRNWRYEAGTKETTQVVEVKF